MSYEIAKSYAIDLRKNKVTGSFASSNTYPRTFYSGEFNYNLSQYERADAVVLGCVTPKQVMMASMLADLVGGNIKLYRSVYFKYRYALMKAMEYVSNKYGDLCLWTGSQELVNGKKNYDTEELYIKQVNKIKECVLYFFDLIRDVPEKGNFVIEISNGCYLTKMNLTNYHYTYSKANAKKYKTRWEAELDSREFSWDIIKL